MGRKKGSKKKRRIMHVYYAESLLTKGHFCISGMNWERRVYEGKCVKNLREEKRPKLFGLHRRRLFKKRNGHKPEKGLKGYRRTYPRRRRMRLPSRCLKGRRDFETDH